MLEDVKIGVNGPLFKDSVAQAGIYETMRRLLLMGVHYIELSQIDLDPDTVKELHRGMEDFGIEILAMTAGLLPNRFFPGRILSLEEDFEELMGYMKELHCEELRIVSAPPLDFSSREHVISYAEACEAAALRLLDRGVNFSYHSHCPEFCRFDGMLAIDLYLEQAPHMGMEICSYWMQAGGADTEELIRRYQGRGRLLHLKDYRIGKPKERIPLPEEKGAPPRFELCQTAEIGEGNLDMAGIIRAGALCGRPYMFIEQDQHYGRTEFECIEKSYENLRRMGFGENL